MQMLDIYYSFIKYNKKSKRSSFKGKIFRIKLSYKKFVFKF